jgi:hypothetical protein
MLACFIATAFVSACLVFSVQPLLGRLALPRLGGGPAVWTTCMLFFQVALLAGYGLAWGLARLGFGLQSALYAAALGVGALALPVGLGPGYGLGALDTTSPIPWLLVALASGAGGPLLVLTATTPLLQSWLAASSHPRSRDPYFLFAASNAGSLLALLLYPTLAEPALGLEAQSLLWSFAYGVLALLALCCADAARGGSAAAPHSTEPERPHPDATTWRWLLLALAPASLLVGVTHHITTDLAPAPLLWVVPLAVYLASFIAAFSPWGRVIARRAQTALPPFAALAIVLVLLGSPGWIGLQLAVHLGVLALAGTACHGRLAELRPPASRLTSFYLWLALGGALGGAFNALAGPVLFDWNAEYPLALALAWALQPHRGGRASRARETARRVWTAHALWSLAPLFLFLAGPLVAHGLGRPEWSPALSLTLGGAGCLGLGARPARGALALLLLVGIVHLDVHTDPALLHIERGFHGVHRVVRADDGSGWHTLWNGTTRHGVQHHGSGFSTEPTAYYARGGPAGDLMASLGEAPRRLGLVGLGAGTLAAYGRPNWYFTWFEVDPAVVRIASDPELFTFLSDSPAQIEIVVGDARVSLEKRPDRFDLMLVDAFSSDAVPVHLLTTESVALYLSRLRPGGLLGMHVTNRHLDLVPVVGAIAESLGVPALVRRDTSLDSRERVLRKDASTWVALAASYTDLAALRATPEWEPLRPSGLRAWTDDRADLFAALRRGSAESNPRALASEDRQPDVAQPPPGY